jgi:probable F420-dependent oxidoreductase
MASRKAFRFGIINEQALPGAAWRDHVRRVEALGFATFLLRDHIVPDYFGDQYGPIAAMAMAAAITERLHVGSLVIDNDYRHPAFLAKEATTIDALSGRRFELGLGAGWLRTEYEAAGIPFDAAGVRIERLEESIRILKGLFAGESVQFQGKHYQLNGVQNFPRASRAGGPALLIGAGQKRMLQLAGREADIIGLLTTSVASGAMIDDTSERTPAAVEQKLAWVREGAGARYDQLELSLIPTLILTDERRTRTEQLIRERGWQNTTVEEVWAMPSVLIGSLDEVVAGLHERRERYGFSYFIFSDGQLEGAAAVVARVQSAI